MPDPPRRTQAERRAQSRRAILDAAAADLASGGYGRLNVDEVAAKAGYTRGALYHQFPTKDALAQAAIDREWRYWQREVGVPAVQDPDPAHALLELPRHHAVFCRRAVAPLLATLRSEFRERPHPVGESITAIHTAGIAFLSELIRSAQAAGGISATTDPEILAAAYYGALEGTAIALAGQAPLDEELAVSVIDGLLNPRDRGQAN